MAKKPDDQDGTAQAGTPDDLTVRIAALEKQLADENSAHEKALAEFTAYHEKMVADLQKQLASETKAVKPSDHRPAVQDDYGKKSPDDVSKRVLNVNPKTGDKSFWVQIPNCLLGRYRINGVKNGDEALMAYKGIAGIWHHEQQAIVSECKD